MAFLELMALDVAKDVAMGVVVGAYQKQRQAEATVRRWDGRSRIPIAGYYLKRYAGEPNGRIQAALSERIVRYVRWFVNTQSFDDAVLALFRVVPILKQKAQRHVTNSTAKASGQAKPVEWPKVNLV
jgi:hypothetical protein